ncbi:MAG TPA: DNA mismatch repair protein MutS [Deltaproteobacteria bacterium]|nr:DNA mismatch repair protein MutS [Deltaproteobacteria bacterium]
MTPNENLTPMLRQYLEIKAQHQDAILFFRLGDFYEMFFEDAVKASAVLEITLTSRNKNAEESVPLCGVPYHSAASYIRKLIESGLKVAICEQVEDPKAAKGIVRREVTRVITPGLQVEEENLSSSEANYLAALAWEGEQVHLGMLDISTGEVLCGHYEGEESAFQELTKHPVKELLIRPQDLEAPFCKRLKAAFPQLLFSHYFGDPIPAAEETELFAEIFLESRAALDSPVTRSLLDRLLGYARQTQKSLLKHLGKIHFVRGRQYLGMDSRTFRHLELLQNARGEGSRHTLFWVLNRTQSAMGARRLKRWIHYPLVDIPLILSRQEAVAELVEAPEFLEGLQSGLKPIQDIERMLGKLSLGTVHARDLSGLARSLSAAQDLVAAQRALLRASEFQTWLGTCPDLRSLAEQVSSELLPDLPLTIREGGMIASGVHPELDELRAVSRDGKSVIAAMEEEERKRTKIPSLKIRYNKVFGYYIEITHTHRENVPADYVRKQTLANAERYITPALKEYENKVLGAEERIKALEYDLFCRLREACVAQIAAIRRVADTLGCLDALAALARVARDNRYVRPELCNDHTLELRDSRHPVLEKMSAGERFIPNDIAIGGDKGRLFLITGPNMAGKSTVMRQVALTLLMAQMGGFVPAGQAKIGVADQIFARIGASDDLSQGQSTFMVEMLETAAILKAATERSFIILDEIGRGTSTYDGMSIAWAIAEHVAEKIRCRALFATHYHELTDLAEQVAGVANYQVAVKEWNDQILFLRKLLPGGASRSYGIEVARLAGLPEALLQRAREVLHHLENAEDAALGKLSSAKPAARQLGLFEAAPHPVLEELRRVQPETLSPIEALNYLFELKGKANS